MRLILAIHFVLAGTASGQDFLWKRVLKMPEPEQVAFVKSIIAQDLRNSNPSDQGERGSALMMLMLNKGDTFIPLFAEAIESEIPNDEPLSNGIVRRAVGCILTARSILAMETIERLFRDDKVRFDRYIPAALMPDWGSKKKQTILIWYKAMDSGNPNLKEAAAKWVQEILGNEVHLPEDYEALTAAMQAHYGHYPEEKDFQTDPLIAAIENKNVGMAYETRRKVLEISNRLQREKGVVIKKE